MELGIKSGTLQTESYHDFTQGLKEPCHLTLFQVPKRRGVGLLAMELPLARLIAERMLGGKGKETLPTEQLTEIESLLVEDTLKLLLGSWCSQFLGEESPADPRIIGTESSGRFLHTSTRDVVMLSAGAEVICGDALFQLLVGVPISMVEAAIKKIRQSKERPTEKRQLELRRAHESISLEITAQWSLPEKTIAEIAALEPGSLISMPLETLDQTQVCIAGEPRLLGTVGIESDKVAVKIAGEI